MEVRIKQGNDYVDADWTIEDNVMVVSPKGKICEFKDGDVLASDKSKVIYIFKENVSEDSNIGYIGIDNNQDLNLTESQWGNLIFRPATEEEKQKLFDKLAEEGWELDADKKELVNLKWKPKVGDTYFRPDFNRCRFLCYKDKARYETMICIKDRIEKGWIFKTEQECQEFCNRLNEAINSVKP